MMRTMMLKLRATEEQKEALLRTMEAYSIAFNITSEWGFRNKQSNKFAAQEEVYYSIRERIPDLGASLVQTAIHCSCEALRGCGCRTKPLRRQHAAMRYSIKSIRIILAKGFASFSTIKGRIKVDYELPDYFKNKYCNWSIYSYVISLRKASRDLHMTDP